MQTRRHVIKSVTERFCPQVGKNIVLEVSIGRNGERIESYLLRREDACGEKGCVMREIPPGSASACFGAPPHDDAER